MGGEGMCYGRLGLVHGPGFDVRYGGEWHQIDDTLRVVSLLDRLLYGPPRRLDFPSTNTARVYTGK